MKQGTWATRIIMLVLFIGIVAYFCFTLLHRTTNPYRTETVYRYVAEDTIPVNGLVVRSEEVLPGVGDAGMLDILPVEGERVARGSPLARIYADDEELARQNEVEAITQQLEELSYFSGADRSTTDVTTLDSEITNLLFQLHTQTAARDFSRLDETKRKLETLLLRRSMAYEGGVGAEELVAMLQERLAVLQGQLQGAESIVYSPDAGNYSGRVDGYETLVTPASLVTMTPTDFQELMEADPEPDATAMGKLITESRWYFVTVVDEEAAAKLSRVNQVSVRFLRAVSGDVPMRVESLGVPEDGKVLVVLSGNRDLIDTTLLRRQPADIILSRSEGMRVSKSAIRVKDDGTVGVYCVEGLRSSFKPVTITGEDGDYYLVEPVNPGAYGLHVGSEVLVSGLEIEEGRVIWDE